MTQIAKLVGVGALLALGALTGCSNGSAPIQHAANSSTQPVVVAASTSATPVDPNIAICDGVHQILLTLKAQMAGWDATNDLFNKKLAANMRDDATKLFGEEVRATGSVKDAIHAEATGLVNMSIAMNTDDASMASTAGTAFNASIAQVRGVCGF